MHDIELRVTTDFEQVEMFERRIVGNIPKEEHEFFCATQYAVVSG